MPGVTEPERLRVIRGPAESIRTTGGDMRPVVWGEHGMVVWVRVRAAAGPKLLRCVVSEAAGDALHCENAAMNARHLAHAQSMS